MKSGVHILFVFFLFHSSLKIMGQGIRLPSQTVLFDQFSPYFNAALQENHQGLKAGTQVQTGAFSDFRQFYFLGSIALGKKKTNGIGLSFYSTQEGELISENRLKGSYWAKIKLNEKVSVIAGGELGLINLSLGATRSTPGSNSFSPDLDLGLAVEIEDFTFSASFNQIGSLSTIPLTQEISFQNFTTLFAEYYFTLNPYFDLNLYSYSFLIPNVNNQYQGKALLGYKETFYGGIDLGSNGLGSSFTWRGLPFDKKIGISFAVQFPVFTSETSFFRPIQIHLDYLI